MKTDQLVVSSWNRAFSSKITKAKELCREYDEQFAIFLETTERMMWSAYKIGKILNELKQEVGHGKWMIWLTEHFRELGQNDRRITDNAARYMNLARMNLNPRNSGDLSVESRRKFLWGHIPSKERPMLEGDSKDSPVLHPLTCRNYWEKWDRQQRTGQIPPLPIDLLWHDLEPMFLRMAEVLGIQRCIERLQQHQTIETP
jgi:hypothetical protein